MKRPGLAMPQKYKKKNKIIKIKQKGQQHWKEGRVQSNWGGVCAIWYLHWSSPLASQQFLDQTTNKMPKSAQSIRSQRLLNELPIKNGLIEWLSRQLWQVAACFFLFGLCFEGIFQIFIKIVALSTLFQFFYIYFIL